MRARRGALVLGVLGGCTEPNPYLDPAGSSTGGTTGSSSTTALGTTAGPGQSSSGSTDTGGGSSGEVPACVAMGMECTDAAPEGWLGPFAWRQQPTSERPAGCEAPWEVPLVEASSVVSAPAARCGCSCGPYSNGSCGSGTVTRYSQAGCMGPSSNVSVAPGCNELPGMGWAAGGSYLFEPPPIEGGGCLPMGSLVKQTASFLEQHLACGGRWAPQGCEPGRLCVPPPADPFHPRLCIAWEDDVECPPGSDYAQRTLLYRGLDDDRGCETCTCTLPTGPCVGGFGDLSSTAGCTGVGAQLPPGVCTSGGALGVASVDYIASAPLGSCEPAIVLPTGQAVGTQPVTFCCTR